MAISTESVKMSSINEEFFKKYLRVLKLARTPTRDEFTKIAIVAAIGVLIIGLLGFIIYVIMTAPMH
ncbi:protein translocase SEC61 complex subunit gamma [Methanofollis sp. W23]|uniref:protein translocase SEC61 complex subunit gamma n=1 Tax=Methanofollis sp. W23 TaxID=2817849 RepID=UPI001AE5CD86|nr:protein translocase SEC61 complex subunit gamma [Methanofollis sp. W23]